MADINEKLMNGAGLAELWNIIGGKYGNLVKHCWKYRTVEAGYVIGSQKKLTSLDARVTGIVWYYADSYTISKDGMFVLDNPAYTENGWTNLIGKYRIKNAAQGEILYYSDSSATTKTYQMGETVYGSIEPSYEYKLSPSVISGEWAYVFMDDRNAFPDNEVIAGTHYVYAGVPLYNSAGALKIQTGSYVGTGASGANSACTISTDVDPMVVVITQKSGEAFAILPSFKYTAGYLQYGYVYGGDFKQVSSYYAKKENSAVSWYASSATNQLNLTDTTYEWLAIG